VSDQPAYVPGHEPVVPPRIITEIPTIDAMWLDRFADIGACEVSDAVGPLYTMAPEIAPLYTPINRLVGRALTVKAWPGDSLAVYGALSMVSPGDVLVIDWRGHVASAAGGAQILAHPAEHGLRGIVIDGAWRDAEDMREVDFPMFGRARNPLSPPKRRPGEINVPIACGGVVVEAGDLVVADTEGVTIVPHAYIERVWEAASHGSPPPRNDAERDARAEKRRSLFDRTFTELGGERTPATD
jgi:4-hydroxy-4-methyl-2-oxoglutarate aldolase